MIQVQKPLPMNTFCMLAIYIETTVSERLNPISFNDERFRRPEQNIRYNARINPTGTPSLYVRVSVYMYV